MEALAWEYTDTLFDEYDGYEPPSYSTPGRILVEIRAVSSWRHPCYRYEVEVLYYDAETSVFWINEGAGFEYWFDTYVDLELPGTYVFEGVTGEWGHTDDDEEWYFDVCRRATDDEVAAGCLS